MNAPRAFALTLLLFTLAAAGGSYLLGRSTAFAELEANSRSAQRLDGELTSLREQLRAARGELEMLRTRREVDRQALELVRQEMATQEEHAAELEESLRFYRSLMAPGEAGAGVSLRAPELVALEREGRYAYRIVVQQKARKHELVSGSLAITLFGERQDSGETWRISLAELTTGEDEVALPLRFRYFQSVEGELELPSSLRPSGIEVVATLNRPDQAQISREYPWRVQERFTHVGK